MKIFQTKRFRPCVASGEYRLVGSFLVGSFKVISFCLSTDSDKNDELLSHGFMCARSYLLARNDIGNNYKIIGDFDFPARELAQIVATAMILTMSVHCSQFKRPKSCSDLSHPTSNATIFEHQMLTSSQSGNLTFLFIKKATI